MSMAAWSFFVPQMRTIGMSLAREGKLSKCVRWSILLFACSRCSKVGSCMQCRQLCSPGRGQWRIADGNHVFPFFQSQYERPMDEPMDVGGDAKMS
jgi:hypothetical protein